MGNLPKIELPSNFNYIAAFLTFRCNLSCSYCINNYHGKLSRPKEISGRHWVAILDRFGRRSGLPVTLQGGEPSLHRDFIYIINHLRRDIPIDILTNLKFDFKDFAKRVDPQRLKRDAPYAPIRVSYHPEQMNFWDVVSAVLYLKGKGFDVGVWCIKHPVALVFGSDVVDWAGGSCKTLGIDFRIKEFLGRYQGSLYGTYKYPIYNFGRKVLCKATELLIAPDAEVYRCHRDLY